MQQAKILGHDGMTVGSLHARASCDTTGSVVLKASPVIGTAPKPTSTITIVAAP